MVDEKKPKPLPPSLRGRRRYIAFQVFSEGKFITQDLINSIWHSLLNLLGELGASQADIWIARDIYDEVKQIGIIRCSHNNVEQVRTALALIERIGDIRVVQCDDRAACWRRWDEIYSAEVELENQIEIVSVIRGA